MVNSKPPAPELATMAPLLRRLSIERPWQPIALMVLARLGAGLALAKPAPRPRFIAASPWIAAHPSMAQGPIP